ncbi:MAG: serine--tRNA ligase, partial [Corynebacterium sp.]|nr:serine--tRNA ligase [Corynebacterium sp.]
MIDLKFLRENPDVVRESQRTRGEDPALVDRLLEADQRRREAISAADQARAEQKAFSKTMGKAMKDASDEERDALRAEGKTRSAAVKELEDAQSAAEADVQDLQMKLSNVVTGAPAGGE